MAGQYILTGTTSDPSKWGYRLVVNYGDGVVGANPYTPVTVIAQVARVDNYTTYLKNTNKPISITIDGQAFSATISYNFTNMTKYDWRTLWSTSKNVYHNSDGTKYLSLSSYWNNSGASPASGSASGGFSLPTIPVTSLISSAPNTLLGKTCTIGITRYTTDATHTLRYSFGTLTGTIATGVATTYAWSVPTTSPDFYGQILNSPSGTCTLYCDTYIGGSKVGESSTTLVLSADPALASPTFTYTLTDTDAAVTALTGSNQIFVRYYSDIAYSASVSLKYGASLSEFRITSGTKYETGTSGTLTNMDGDSIELRATDSRTLAGIVYRSTNIVPYINLAVGGATFQRATVGSTTVKLLIEDGEWFNGYFNPPTNTTANNLTVKYRYREYNVGASWGSYVDLSASAYLIKTGNTFSFSGNLSGTFIGAKDWEFELLITDSLNTTGVLITRVVPSYQINLAFGTTILFSGSVFDYVGYIEYSAVHGRTMPTAPEYPRATETQLFGYKIDTNRFFGEGFLQKIGDYTAPMNVSGVGGFGTFTGYAVYAWNKFRLRNLQGWGLVATRLFGGTYQLVTAFMEFEIDPYIVDCTISHKLGNRISTFAMTLQNPPTETQSVLGLSQLVGEESSLLRAGQRLDIFFSMGDSSGYRLGAFYIDNSDYTVYADTVSISGRNGTGRLLKDSYVTSLYISEGTYNDVVSNLFGFANISSSIVDLPGSVTEYSLTNRNILEVLDEMLLANPTWRLEENAFGQFIMTTLGSTWLSTPDNYLFRRNKDIFSRSIRLDDSNVWSKVVVYKLGTTPYSKTFNIPTYTGWSIPPYKIFYQEVDESVSNAEIDTIAQEAALQLSYAGKIETFDGPLRPHLQAGDGIAIDSGTGEYSQLGRITELQHKLGASGFFTSFNADNGGSVGRKTLSQYISEIVEAARDRTVDKV